MEPTEKELQVAQDLNRKTFDKRVIHTSVFSYLAQNEKHCRYYSKEFKSLLLPKVEKMLTLFLKSKETWNNEENN